MSSLITSTSSTFSSSVDVGTVSMSAPLSSQSTSGQNRGSGSDNGNGNAFKSSSASNLYLYTFLATLVLLLLVSTAVIIRSVTHRVRARRALEAAIRNGTYNPPARVTLANTPKPPLYDAYLQDDTTDEKGVGLAGFTPITAAFVIPTDQPCLPPPATSSDTNSNPGFFSRAGALLRLPFLSAFVQDLFDELRSRDIHSRLQQVRREDHQSRTTQADVAAAVFGGASWLSEEESLHASPVCIRVAVFIAMPDPANASHRDESCRGKESDSVSSTSSSKGKERASAVEGMAEDLEAEVPHIEFGVTDIKLSS